MLLRVPFCYGLFLEFVFVDLRKLAGRKSASDIENQLAGSQIGYSKAALGFIRAAIPDFFMIRMSLPSIVHQLSGARCTFRFPSFISKFTNRSNMELKVAHHCRAPAFYFPFSLSGRFPF